MKIVRLVRILAVVAALGIFPAIDLAASCTSNGRDPIHPIAGRVECRVGFGKQVLFGFDEFSEPSTPAKKYRRMEITGKMKFGVWDSPLCPTPDYPLTYSKSGSDIAMTANGSPFGWSYQASLSPGGRNANGTITYSASLAILAGGGEYTAGAIFVEGIRVANGGTIDLFPGVYSVFVGVPYAYWSPIPGSEALFGAMVIDQYRDEWNLQRTYVGPDGIESNLGTGGRFFKRQMEPLESGGEQIAADLGSVSLSYGSGVTQESHSITRITRGTDKCLFLGMSSSKYSGTITETLSEEDTEDSALSRARAKADTEKAAAGYLPSAYAAFETTLNTALAVDVCHVDFRTQLEIPCPGEYDLHVTYAEKPHGAAGPVIVTEMIERRHFESGIQTTKGSINVKKKDTDYSITGIAAFIPCAAHPEAGSPDLIIGSIQARFSFGQSTAGTSAGDLALNAEVITPEIYTPSALMTAISVDGSVDIIRDASNAVRQAKSPQALADVVRLNSAAYEIRFYATGDIGLQDSQTKIYALNGAPLAIYKLENPDASQNIMERLRITETRGSVVRLSEYAYDVDAHTWTLSSGNGLRRESKTTLLTGMIILRPARFVMRRARL